MKNLKIGTKVRLNEEFRHRLRFIEDPAIREKSIGVTTEIVAVAEGKYEIETTYQLKLDGEFYHSEWLDMMEDI